MSNATDDAMKQALIEIKKGCHAYQPDIRTSYGYVPSLAAGIVFCILFAVPLFYHTFQSIRLRATVSILLALGALTELVGWASRTYNAKCPYNRDAFISQEVTLIIAPVFLSAALYVLLGKLIVDLGRRSSILTAKWYAIIFCACDVLSLVVQALGGARASAADTTEAMQTGTHIMVAGIAFQLFTMTLFGALGADFLWRVLASPSRAGEFRGRVTRGARLVFGALFVSFLMVYIRSVYRTIELVQGWHGYLITHEGYFIGLDAVIMVVAVAVFMVVDPAVVFRRESRPGFAKRGAAVKGQSSPDASDGEIGMSSVRY